MRNALRWGLLLGIAALTASGMPVRANCFQDPRAITSFSQTAPSYLYTPGAPFAPKCSVLGEYPSDGMYSCGGTISYYAVGFFWAWGGGSPIWPAGIDHGGNLGQLGSNWLQHLYHPYKASIGGPYSHWQFPGTDGCITTTGSSTTYDFDECQIVVLSDANGPNGYFLAMSVPPDIGFDFHFDPSMGFPPRLELVPVPRPKIEKTASLGENNGLQVHVSLPVGSLVPQNGFRLQCHGGPGEILTGWKLYARSYASSGGEPLSGESRAVATMPFPMPDAPPVTPWQLVSGPTPVPIGSQAVIAAPCSDTQAVALCATLTFGGPSNSSVFPDNPDWELLYCSRSTVVTCGEKKRKSMLRFDDRSSEPAVPRLR